MPKPLFVQRRSESNATMLGGAGQMARSSSVLAVLICSAITAVAVAIMLNNECSQSPSQYGFHAHLLEWVGSEKHYVWQSRGYFVLLLLCASFVLSAPKCRQYLIEQAELRRRTLHYLVLTLGLAAFAGKLFQNPGGVAFGLVCLPFLVVLLRQKRLSKNLCLFFLVGYVAVLTVPGLIVIPDLSAVSAGKFLEIQTHYSDVVGIGPLLASGKKLFLEVDPFYGFVQPVFIALFGNQVRSLSFGSYVEIVRIFQATFIVMAAGLFFRLSGKAKISSLFAIAFFAQMMQLNQMSEYFPNQTAWRLLGFPVSIIGILALRSLSPAAMSYAFGALACSLLLFNFETGLCILAGFLAFLYLREPSKTLQERILRLTKTFAVFAVGMLSSFVLMYVAAWLILGYAPDLVAFANLMAEKQLMVKSGYFGGGRLSFQPIPFLLVTHCLYTIVKISLESDFPANFRNALRVAISTMCLLWFTYFVNRPAPGDQYLIGCYFLYSFLVIDLVRAAVIGLRRKSSVIEPALVTCALLSLIIVPRISQQLKNTATVFKATVDQLRHGPAQPPAMIVSGVYLPSKFGEELLRQADFIKSVSRNGPVCYLTATSFVIPCLSGISTSAPVTDLFSNLALQRDTDRLVELLNSKKVSPVIVDSPDTVLVGFKSWVDCFDDLRRRLSRYYVHTSTRDGWEIWTRKTELSQPSDKAN